MMTARQRNAVLKRIFDYFNAQGKILSEQEYIKNGGPVRYLAIKKSFRSYNSMVAILKKRYPTWSLSQEPEKVASPVIEEVRRDPLAELAKKVREEEEIDDEDE